MLCCAEAWCGYDVSYFTVWWRTSLFALYTAWPHFRTWDTYRSIAQHVVPWYLTHWASCYDVLFHGMLFTITSTVWHVRPCHKIAYGKPVKLAHHIVLLSCTISRLAEAPPREGLVEGAPDICISLLSLLSSVPCGLKEFTVLSWSGFGAC